MRRICVLTGSRADYGLLKTLMKLFASDPDFELEIIATGSHLSKYYGNTIEEIYEDGFNNIHAVEILGKANTEIAVAKSVSKAIHGIANKLHEIQPAMVVILGDRFEALAAAIASHLMLIPIVHIHGGETSVGSTDEAFRHSITKMSYLHFVSTTEYRNRVIQLGEDPERVFNVGGLGSAAIENMQLLSREELTNKFGIQFGKKNLLVTFHPATLESTTPQSQMHELLEALDQFTDVKIFFTKSNSDANSLKLHKIINSYSETRGNVQVFNSLGQLGYLSLMSNVDGVVGNSSSGVLEAPSFRVGTVNIGRRQQGRVRGSNVIDCDTNKVEIISAINTILSSEFRRKLKNLVNPYSKPNTNLNIYNEIKSLQLPVNLSKVFYDLKVYDV